MNTKEDKITTVKNIVALANEWLKYVEHYGNECAYTDCLLESVMSHASKAIKG